VGGTALAVPSDIADQTQAEAAVVTVVDRFGRIDILINNAGLMLIVPIVKADVEAFGGCTTAGSEHAKASILQGFGGGVPNAGGCPRHQGDAEIGLAHGIHVFPVGNVMDRLPIRPRPVRRPHLRLIGKTGTVRGKASTSR
jgi:hypothetical protein